MADLIGGDFNCTPESSICQELANFLGPSVLQLDGTAPYVIWDRLSAKPGVGQTIDSIFIRESASCQTVQAAAQVAFAAAALDQRLSDHLGIEAVVNLRPGSSQAGMVGPFFEGPPMRTVEAGYVLYGGGD